MEVYVIPALWKRALTMLGVLAVVAGSAFFTLAINNSQLPAEIDMASGTHDYGGQSAPAAMNSHIHQSGMEGMIGSSANMVSVVDLTGPSEETPDRRFTREFTLILDNKLRFYNRNLDVLYTLNGEVFPDTPMLMVKEGDLVKTTIINRGNVEHPMHLHGHHALEFSRNDKPSTGSPWWSDTLDVQQGETYEVAFLANNPGLWMDHCHNLVHAAAGMTMHLMYEGVTTPFSIGSSTNNHPE